MPTDSGARDSAEVLQWLERLRDAFHPPPEVDKRTLKIYARLLAEFDHQVLAAAAPLLARTSKWFPSIAEIRSACLEVAGERAKLPGVGEAWAEARREASRVGAYASPVATDFSHDVVRRAAILTAGSWRRWCLSEDEAPLRSRFFQVFQELRDREVTRAALPESARYLTAEESRLALEEVQARARKALPGPAGGESEGETPRRVSPAEIGKALRALVAPPKETAIVGRGLTKKDWEAKKAALLEKAGMR